MAQCCNNTVTPKMIRTGQMKIGDRIELEDIVASSPEFQIKDDKQDELVSAPAPAEPASVEPVSAEPVSAEPVSAPAPTHPAKSAPPAKSEPQAKSVSATFSPISFDQMTPYLDQKSVNTNANQPYITIPQTPMTTRELTETIDITDVQSYLGFLRTQIGRYMRVEQLMGSNIVENRYGFLVGIGSNFIILQEITSGNIMVVDLFTIRLTYIYYGDPVLPN